jgi:glucose/arabinose dehydrogenase
MSNRHRTVWSTVVGAMLLSLAAACSQPADAGASLTVQKVKGGLNGPAGFTFTPKGIIYYLQRGTGAVRVLNPDTGNDRPFFKIGGVNGSGERGALGIALHPNWPKTPFAYVYVTRRAHGRLMNQLVRIRAKNGHGVAYKVLLQAPAASVPYHNGGRIGFGPDGKLYVMIGDGHDDANAQDRSHNLRGKMLRINPDGSIPKTNPFKASRIWSFGHRNSYGFTFDPQTGRLWETENGPACNDEINLVIRGGNFGWGPKENCSGSSPGDTNNSGPKPRRGPKLWFGSTIGITGAAFCDGCGLGPSYEGDLLFGAVNDGNVRVVALNGARNGISGSASIAANNPGGVYSMETAPDGTIYFSDASAIYRLAP